MSTQKKGQGKKPADPSRFEIRSELEDGTGFKIMGSKEIFKYDQHKGWSVFFLMMYLRLEIGMMNMTTTTTQRESLHSLQKSKRKRKK